MRLLSLCQLEDIPVPLDRKQMKITHTHQAFTLQSCMYLLLITKTYERFHVKWTHLIIYMTHLWYWMKRITHCSSTLHSPKTLLGWILFVFAQRFVPVHFPVPPVETVPGTQAAYNYNLIRSIKARCQGASVSNLAWSPEIVPDAWKHLGCCESEINPWHNPSLC